MQPESEHCPLKRQVRNIDQSSVCAPIVFIHGWGSDSRLWQPLLDHLEGYPVVLIDLPGFGFNRDCCVTDFDQMCRYIKALLPDKSHIVGWSLGGMIAAQLCSRYPDAFFSLTTIGSNAKFVQSEDWNEACSGVVYENFTTSFGEEPESTLNRFFQLQAQGDIKRKELVRLLRQNKPTLGVEQKQQWQRALFWLGDIDNRELLFKLKIPQKMFLGRFDELVPSSLKERFFFNDNMRSCVVLDECGHAPHITQSSLIAGELIHFLRIVEERVVYKRDKKKVADAFSAAAKTYDAIATLQQNVARQLVKLKDDYHGQVCDLGCGTGFCMEYIKETEANVVGLDFAEGMLLKCRNKMSEASSQTGVINALVCGDFDELPFDAQTFDGICSSMSIQWSENLATVFREVKRVLKPGAWFLFSTLGPKTLFELRSSWREVDEYVHINDFDEKTEVISVLEYCGFTVEKLKSETQVLQYDSVYTMMRELKAIGAHNVNAGKNAGLTTRGKIKKLELAYEKYRKGGLLPATYDVYYFLVKAP